MSDLYEYFQTIGFTFTALLPLHFKHHKLHQIANKPLNFALLVVSGTGAKPAPIVDIPVMNGAFPIILVVVVVVSQVC